MISRLRSLLHANDPVSWAASALGFHADPLQSAILSSRHPRIILNCARQWGKSTVTAIKALHHALFNPKRLVLVLSPSARQTSELVRKIAVNLAALDLTPRRDGANQISLLLPNSSRIVGLPSGDANLRGFSAVNLLIIDEAARVPDVTYRAVRPFLAAASGTLMLLSTPFGRRGFFHDAWNDRAFKPFQASATQCPRFSKSFLDEERKTLGELWFSQEYECVFIDDGTRLFSDELIDQAIDSSLEPLF